MDITVEIAKKVLDNHYDCSGHERLMEIKELLLSQQAEIERLKSETWINVNDIKPAIENDKFYGKRYSEPVIIYDQYQKPRSVKWDTEWSGWVDSSFKDGSDATDYDYTADYYCLIPKAPEVE